MVLAISHHGMAAATTKKEATKKETATKSSTKKSKKSTKTTAKKESVDKNNKEAAKKDSTSKNKVTAKTKSSTKKAESKANKPFKGAVNVNRATKKQLMELPGIGPVKADEIIKARKKLGKFKRSDDLLKVKGIGDKTLKDIKKHLKF